MERDNTYKHSECLYVLSLSITFSLALTHSHSLSRCWLITCTLHTYKHSEGLPGGAVVKGAVLQRQLCHQRLWVRAQALSQPAATGRSVGRRTIGLASSGLRRAWPVGISLSHRAPATPVAGRTQCTLTKVARCTVYPPTHWCGWLPGWMRAVLRSRLGCVSEDA